MTWTPPPHDRERELREHLPEAGWREAMAEICARHQLDATELAPFPSGSDVVWGAGQWVLKLTAAVWQPEIAAEVRTLCFVEQRLSVATPKVLVTGELAGWPYLVMSRVPGLALAEVWSSLEHGQRLRLAADLGRLTRELHALPLHGYEQAPEGDGQREREFWATMEWDPFWRGCLERVSTRHGRDELPPELAQEIDPFLARVGELEQGPRVLLHTEILDQHVLVERRGGRLELSAMIDFADSRVGPAAYEFPAPVEFIFRGEPGLLRAYLGAYGYADAELTSALSERLLAWGLCHRFGRLLRMLRAIEPARPGTLGELASALYGFD